MIIERIAKYLDFKGIATYKAEENSGISNGTLSKAIREKTSIRTDILDKFLKYHGDISPEWLLTGKGSMLRDDEHIPIAQHTDNPNEGVPLIPLSAMAGVLSGEDIQIMAYDCDRYIVPMFGKYDFLIQVKGSSMYPKYSSGDLVACRRLQSWSFFQYGKPYIIQTSQGTIIKRIYKGADDEHINIVSDNKEMYPPFELHREEIQGLAMVIGVIRLE